MALRLAKWVRTKVRKHVNDSFPERLSTAFFEKFNLKIDCGFNIFTMTLVSRREDDREFTKPQAEFVRTFEAGYLAAMEGITK